MIPYFRPEAIDLIGPLKVQPFGVLLAIGFILGSLWCQKYARRRGMDPKIYTDVLFWMALGAMVFGHLGHVFYEPDEYIKDPMKVFRIWEGLSSFGGYFGCTATCVWFFKSRGIKPLRGGDLLIIGAVFGIFVGRLGCFVVHDHIGTEVTDSHAVFQRTIGPLGVKYPSLEEAAAVGAAAIADGDRSAKSVRRSALAPGDGFCCPEESSRERCPCNEQEAMAVAGAWAQHYPPGAIGTVRYDLGLMDSLLGLFTFLVLIWFARKPRGEGFLLGLAPMVYMPIRLVWDSLRNTDLGGTSSDVRYFFDMTPGQIGAIILFAIGSYVVWRSRKLPSWPEPETKPWVAPPSAK
jgi:prolipoprotein diacylglyceryltransferase